MGLQSSIYEPKNWPGMLQRVQQQADLVLTAKLAVLNMKPQMAVGAHGNGAAVANVIANWEHARTFLQTSSATEHQSLNAVSIEAKSNEISTAPRVARAAFQLVGDIQKSVTKLHGCVKGAKRQPSWIAVG